MKKIISLCFIILSVIVLDSCSSLGSLDLPSSLSGIMGSGGSKKLDEKTIIAGLKEALQIGTENAVKYLSKKNGYFKNADVFIPLPEDLKEVDKALRTIGMGKKMDEFIEEMNHAAEQAAEKAADIFINAIKQMTLRDARNILYGDDTAATQYFEDKTRSELYSLFFPVIKSTLDKLGVTKLYKTLLDAYNKIPFVNKKNYDIDKYATNLALDGLFFMLGEEEKKIRKDPAARVTELLRTVFG